MLTFLGGLAVGIIICVVFFFVYPKPQLTRLEQLENRLQKTREALEAAEYDNQAKTAALESVQKTEKTKANQEIEALKQQHQSQIQQLETAYQTKIEELEKKLQATTIETEDSETAAATPRQRQAEDINPLFDDFMSIASADSDPTEELEADNLSSVISPETIATELEATPIINAAITPNISLKKPTSELISKITNISQLFDYIHARDPQIRALAATNFGNIIAKTGFRNDSVRVLSSLEKLSRDPEISVRKATVKSLSKIKSEKVIPLLQIALKDADSEVVKLASEGINQLKNYRVKPQAKLIAKPTKKGKS